jgi:hypothetical protein
LESIQRDFNILRSLKVEYIDTICVADFGNGMEINMNKITEISINFPAPDFSLEDSVISSSQDSFTIEAEGTGSITGISYTVPAHTEGKVSVDIKMMAITTQNVKDLNDLIMSLLDASRQEYVREYSRTHASANISIWSIFGGGGSASYEKISENMHSLGLTDEQITMIINKLFDIANQFTNVKLELDVHNTDNDFSVSGEIDLYTISGTIKTSKGTTQYRFLADKGAAKDQSGEKVAPVTGEVIPIS